MKVLGLTFCVLSSKKTIKILITIVTDTIFFCKDQVDMIRSNLGSDPYGVDVTCRVSRFILYMWFWFKGPSVNYDY